MSDTIQSLGERFNIHDFRLTGGKEVVRRLSDLEGCFEDPKAYQAALALDNPVVYRVIAVEPASGAGDLHYGLGILYAGKVGNEYFLTKGHLHQNREAAEVYIGQSGEGLMLLEDEHSGESRIAPLGAGQVIYVPGHTAHRTVNIGREPLTYFGIYPANAGHDYAVIAKRNFLQVVVEEDGRPVMKDRATS